MPEQQLIDIPEWWHLCGVALMAFMFLLNRYARTSNIVVIFFSQLPGVVLHELTHLAAGIMFRANPRGFSLIPKRNHLDSSWTLGSVTFDRVTAFNAVPIALAPLGLIPFSYFIYRSWFIWLAPTFSNVLMLYATVFLLIYNSIPSYQDIRVACNWGSILLYGGIAGAVMWYLW